MNQTTLGFLESLVAVESGGTREAVNSAAAELIERYLTDCDTWQAIASEKDFFSLCGLAGLDFYRTLIVVLRSQFERYAVANSSLKTFPSAVEAVRSLTEKTALARSSAAEFYPGKQPGTLNISKLHELFGGAAGGGEDELSMREFIDLVNVILASNIFFESVEGPETDYFIRNHRRELKILRLMEPIEREELLIRKSMVQELEKQFEEALFELNQKKLMLANLDNDFYDRFGDLYIVIARNEQQYSKLSRMVQIKRTIPEMTMEEIENAEAETRQKELEALERLENDILNSKFIKYNTENLLNQFTDIDLENVDLEGYRKQLKKTEREIYTLTHPDMLENTTLTEKQKMKLTECFRRSIEIAGDEKGFSIRLITSLTDIVEEARAIWRSMGVDVDTRFEVEGETACEQLEFLERRIAKLKEIIAQVRNMTFNFMNDPDAKEKLACLGSAHAVKETRRQFESRNVWYERQIRELETELEGMFDSGDFGRGAN